MKSVILVTVAAISLMCSLPASAAIVHYTITFNDPDGAGPKAGGSGILTLNELVAGNLNENAPTVGESFVGTVNGFSFDINSTSFSQWSINLLLLRGERGLLILHRVIRCSDDGV